MHVDRIDNRQLHSVLLFICIITAVLFFLCSLHRTVKNVTTLFIMSDNHLGSLYVSCFL